MIQRISYIDKIKGFAILLVVMGHVAEKSMNITDSLFNIIYSSFHMPLFMFMSGLFAMKSFRKWDCLEMLSFIKKKTLRIMLPFVVIGGLYSFLCYKNLSVFYPGQGGYWFLPALFYCMLIEMLIGYLYHRIAKNFILDIMIHIIVYSLLIAVYYGYSPSIPNYLSFLKMYPFFMFGVELIRYRNWFDYICSSKWVLSVSIIMYFVFLSIKPHIPISVTGFFAIIICIQMFILCDNKVPSVLSSVGQCSLAIYVFHWFLLPSNLSIEKMLIGTGSFEHLCNDNFVLVAMISLALSIPIIFICMVWERIIRHSLWLNLFIFGSKK